MGESRYTEATIGSIDPTEELSFLVEEHTLDYDLETRVEGCFDLAECIVRAKGRACASCVRTSATRAPVSEVSTSIAKHSRVKSSTNGRGQRAGVCGPRARRRGLSAGDHAGLYSTREADPECPFIERFNETYRTEVVDGNDFSSLAEVRAITTDWLRRYNTERPHDSLGRVPRATSAPEYHLQVST